MTLLDKLKKNSTIKETEVMNKSKFFNKKAGTASPFLNSGVYVNGEVFTLKTLPKAGSIKKLVLKDVFF